MSIDGYHAWSVAFFLTLCFIRTSKSSLTLVHLRPPSFAGYPRIRQSYRNTSVPLNDRRCQMRAPSRSLLFGRTKNWSCRFCRERAQHPQVIHPRTQSIWQLKPKQTLLRLYLNNRSLPAIATRWCITAALYESEIVIVHLAMLNYIAMRRSSCVLRWRVKLSIYHTSAETDCSVFSRTRACHIVHWIVFFVFVIIC